VIENIEGFGDRRSSGGPSFLDQTLRPLGAGGSSRDLNKAGLVIPSRAAPMPRRGARAHDVPRSWTATDHSPWTLLWLCCRGPQRGWQWGRGAVVGVRYRAARKLFVGQTRVVLVRDSARWMAGRHGMGKARGPRCAGALSARQANVRFGNRTRMKAKAIANRAPDPPCQPGHSPPRREHLD
jgi:hypothetical protein